MKQNTPNFEPQCWLICTSQDNFQVDRQNNFSVEGFRARNRRLVSEVKPGDKFVIYINQLQRFGATLQATGKPYTDGKTRIWIEQEEIWPCRFPTKPIVVLEDDQLLDAKKLVTQLSFITDEQKRVNWGLAFHQSLRKIPLDDFELIESEMRKLLALRGKETEGRLLTEEQAKEAIMELPLEKKSLHDRIGEMLDTLGSRMGYNSYTNYRVTPEHAVELDVAWLDKRSPEIAIEVQIGGNLIEAKDKLAQAKKFNYRKVIMVIEQAQLPRLNAIIRFDELVDWMEAWSIQALKEHLPSLWQCVDKWNRTAERYNTEMTELVREVRQLATDLGISNQQIEPGIQAVMGRIHENGALNDEAPLPVEFDRRGGSTQLARQILKTIPIRQRLKRLTPCLHELDNIFRQTEEILSPSTLRRALITGHCRLCPVP